MVTKTRNVVKKVKKTNFSGEKKKIKNIKVKNKNKKSNNYNEIIP